MYFHQTSRSEKHSSSDEDQKSKKQRSSDQDQKNEKQSSSDEDQKSEKQSSNDEDQKSYHSLVHHFLQNLTEEYVVYLLPSVQ